MIHLEYQTLLHNNYKVQGQQVALCDALFSFLFFTTFYLLTATYSYLQLRLCARLTFQ